MSVLREKEDIRSLISGMYVDPDIIKFENKYYLYPTTDGYVNWTGTQFHVFSSDNLRNWKDEGIILDVTLYQVPWAVGCAWAPAVFQRKGTYEAGKSKQGKPDR